MASHTIFKSSPWVFIVMIFKIENVHVIWEVFSPFKEKMKFVWILEERKVLTILKMPLWSFLISSSCWGRKGRNWVCSFSVWITLSCQFAGLVLWIIVIQQAEVNNFTWTVRMSCFKYEMCLKVFIISASFSCRLYITILNQLLCNNNWRLFTWTPTKLRFSLKHGLKTDTNWWRD